MGLGAALVLAASAVVVWQVSRARCFSLAGPVICRVATQAPLVALTFDDGPTDLGVDFLVPLLARHGATATFFLIGEPMAHRPDLAARLLAAGHELGNHSYSHAQMIGRSGQWYDGEIEGTEALLTASGSRSGLFRPPYGKKLVGLPLALERHGLRMVTWDVEDPQTADPAAFARQIVAEARPGSIILVHPMYPSNGTARTALPLILDGLERKGLHVVSVGRLLASAPEPGRGSDRSPP